MTHQEIMTLEPIVERLHNGAYRLSDIIGGYRVHQTYYGFTLSEAVKSFRRTYG